MEKKEKVFANGMIFKRNDNAPDWVIGKLSVKEEDFVKFLRENSKSGWLNLNINKGQSGKIYIELDTWENTGKPIAKVAESTSFNNSDLPF